MMAVAKQPSITPETSSGEGLDEEPTSRSEAKWKRFHPFRVVRKIFRRRVKRQGTHEEAPTSKKSWSTSELLSVQDPPEKYEVPSPPYKIGLSVSHDSIFSSESSNIVSTEELSRPQGSSLSVQHAGIKNMFKDELFSRVHARRDSDDDDDIGLPHSPCTSPTTIDVLNQGLKGKSLKSQGACSAGSLISMGSSENDEDSIGASSSGNSSRMSLLERRSFDFDGEPDFSQPVAPLNHKAAHHKIAVRPKRTHGLPQKRLKQQLAASRLSTLPATPEMTEDSGKVYIKEETLSEMTVSSSTFVHEVNSFSSSASFETADTEVIKSSVLENATFSAFESIHSEEMSVEETLVTGTTHSESAVHAEKYDSPSVDIDASFRENTDEPFLPYSSEGMKNMMNSTEEMKPKDMLQDKISHRFEYPANGLCDTSIREADSHSENLDLDMMRDNGSSVFSKDMSSTVSGSTAPDLRQNRTGEGLPKGFDTPPVETSGNRPEEENTLKRDILAFPDDMSTSASLCVSALIKSIEQSEAVSKKDSSYKLNAFRSSAKYEIKKTEPNADTVSYRENMPLQKVSGTAACQTKQNSPEPKHFVEVSESNVTNQSTAEEMMLKSVSHVEHNASEEWHHASEQNQIEMAIKQQFQQQRSVAHHEQVCHVIPGIPPDEESIMSNKYVPASQDLSGGNDSRVVVSHEITEACNLVTVDQTFSTQELYENNVENIVEAAQESEPWISSLDVLSSKYDGNISNITVSSKVYTQKIAEDRVTISINSASEENRSKAQKTNEHKPVVLRRIAKSPVPSDKADHPAHTSSKVSVKPVRIPSSKVSSMEKEGNTENAVQPQHVKTPEPAKRLSVEIVPFSQRVKERKYQPLGFQNREEKPDVLKPASSVERNLSERRVTTKGKDTEKANRHSFSGALSVDVSKISPDISAEKKQAVKPDKLHYPVEIRIKNKTYEKESVKPIPLKERISPNIEPPCEEPSNTPSSLLTKGSKQDTEVKAKWEVKVHSTSLSKKESPGSIYSPSAEPAPKSLSPKPPTSDSEVKKSEGLDISDKTKLHSETSTSATELSQHNRKEIPRRALRETPPSDEPEPELLRVFARRSIKQKHCDKDKQEGKDVISNDARPPSSVSMHSLEQPSKHSEERGTPSPSPSNTSIKSSEESERLHVTSPEVVKKKSKSFCDKEKQGPHYAKPSKEVVLNRRPSLKVSSPDISESDGFLRRQRLASEPEVGSILPPPPPLSGTDHSSALRVQQSSSNTEKTVSLSCRSEHLQRAASMSISPSSTLSNGTTVGMDSLKDKGNPDPATPSWLQLAQQRRELREQRERLLLGSSTNSFLDASSKPSRSSKVWDMVNNFQKMQMT